MTTLPRDHATMAQCYFDWARQQVDRANRTLNPKARNDRLALAEYYLQLAEGELAAARRPAPLTVARAEPGPTENAMADVLTCGH
jgi:hypothetical protein